MIYPKTTVFYLIAFIGLILENSSFADKSTGPSSIIYPRTEPVIRFSHPKHQGQDCLTCHRGIEQSTNVKERNFPTEERCRACHKNITRQTDLEKQSKKPGCTFCHVGYKGNGIPAHLAYPEAHLRFPHRLHHEHQVPCRSCHDFSGREEGRALPLMSTCRSCHRQQRVSNRCPVCHITDKDGRLHIRFDSGWLKPSGSIKGDKHGPDFARNHRGLARSEEKYCQQCHTPKSCLRCHNDTLRPMKIHPGDYISLHAFDARRDQPQCRSCHRYQTFCLGCHQRLGVGQETSGNGFKPNTPRSFHPAGWSGLQARATHHRYAARRNLNQCVSCHRESTCIRCHGSYQQGRGGFSPHAPGFRSSRKCRFLSARNQRVCLKCHAPSDSHLRCE